MYLNNEEDHTSGYLPQTWKPQGKPFLESNSLELIPTIIQQAQNFNSWLVRYRPENPSCSPYQALEWAKSLSKQMDTPLDPVVMKATAALHRFGIEVVGGCGGHSNGRMPFPWVGIAAESRETFLRLCQSRPLVGWDLMPMGWEEGGEPCSAAWYVVMPNTLLAGASLTDPDSVARLLDDLHHVARAVPALPLHERTKGNYNCNLGLSQAEARREKLLAQLPFHQAHLSCWAQIVLDL